LEYRKLVLQTKKVRHKGSKSNAEEH
jgi:hypothetical protein